MERLGLGIFTRRSSSCFRDVVCDSAFVSTFIHINDRDSIFFVAPAMGPTISVPHFLPLLLSRSTGLSEHPPENGLKEVTSGFPFVCLRIPCLSPRPVLVFSSRIVASIVVHISTSSHRHTYSKNTVLCSKPLIVAPNKLRALLGQAE